MIIYFLTNYMVDGDIYGPYKEDKDSLLYKINKINIRYIHFKI